MIAPDVERIEAMGIRCITGDFAAEGDVVRHASDRVAATLLALAMRTSTACPHLAHPAAASSLVDHKS